MFFSTTRHHTFLASPLTYVGRLMITFALRHTAKSASTYNAVSARSSISATFSHVSPPPGISTASHAVGLPSCTVLTLIIWPGVAAVRPRDIAVSALARLVCTSSARSVLGMPDAGLEYPVPAFSAPIFVLACDFCLSVKVCGVYVTASLLPPLAAASFIAATRLLLSSVVRSSRLPMSARSCSSAVGGIAGKGLPSVPPVGATLICATFVVMRGITSPSRAELPTSHTHQSPAVRLSCCFAVISPSVTGTSCTV